MVLIIKTSPASAGNIRDMGSIPGLGRSPGGGRGNPLQCACLENPRDKESGRLQSVVSAKSQKQMKQLCTHAHEHECIYSF